MKSIEELREEFNKNSISPIPYEIQIVNPNYQVLLLTFYNSICNNLNNAVGDKSTIESIHKMIDTEMNNLLRLSNMKVIKMDTIK